MPVVGCLTHRKAHSWRTRGHHPDWMTCGEASPGGEVVPEGFAHDDATPPQSCLGQPLGQGREPGTGDLAVEDLDDSWQQPWQHPLRLMRAARLHNLAIGRFRRPQTHLRAAIQVEGLVGDNSRGGSSPLGRMSVARLGAIFPGARQRGRGAVEFAARTATIAADERSESVAVDCGRTGARGSSP